ncbi:MAG: hypothetical protein RLZ10_2498 [Bacteroidota bacterium]|jgi:hypothetical protein
MKNIHLLPTTKEQHSIIQKNTGLLLVQTPDKVYTGTKLNIYITSDEEIKVDEYYLGEDNNIYCLVSSVNYNGKKIILTTDQELIEEGIQAISDEFLKWFVKNPDCESVEVKPLLSNNGRVFYGYKIIIPQEEPKQETRIFGTKDDKSFWSDKPKQETLEEAAANLADPNVCKTDNWIAGAKWQAERMYSEEELKNAIEISVAKALGVMSFTINEESFEQFKKKQHIK